MASLQQVPCHAAAQIGRAIVGVEAADRDAADRHIASLAFVVKNPTSSPTAVECE